MWEWGGSLPCRARWEGQRRPAVPPKTPHSHTTTTTFALHLRFAPWPQPPLLTWKCSSALPRCISGGGGMLAVVSHHAAYCEGSAVAACRWRGVQCPQWDWWAVCAHGGVE